VLTLTGVALMAGFSPAGGAIQSGPPASVTEGPGSTPDRPASTTQRPGSTPDRPASTRPAPVAKPAAKRGLSRSGLKRQLRQALRSAGGSSGAYVWDLDASRRPLLFTRRGRSGRVPASNQKLFTTAAMLDRFGPDGRLRTAAYARGKRWGARDRVLKGDLVMVGDGDPALGTRQFARSHGLPVTPVGKLARKVKGAGIGRITGRVVADDSIFDRRRGVAASGWSAGPYLSPLSGLSFNSGFDGSRYARKPELRAARQLRRSLRGQGVDVRRKGIGRADLKRPRLERGPLAAVESPTIGTLIAETNKPSNNFYAEMLLKRVGARPGARGTTSRGAHRVEAFARSVGSGVTVSDGSGLGRGNRVTPRQVVRLLVAMQRPGMHGSAFRGSLPLAGHEGTVASRMRGTAAQGRCRAKTGTLSGVSALSGYCDAGRGHTVAFSILMNNLGDVYAARLAQDRMAAAIASYRR
jgi:serine-type D-Ala-D-Ala carboxypeptidase/endopeptidase (penicillin-binding protein 4)